MSKKDHEEVINEQQEQAETQPVEETGEETQQEVENAEESDTTGENVTGQEPVAEDPIEAAQRQARETNEKYLRLYSEFENFRRRTAKEKLEMIRTAGEEVISDLLPVMDDFERAVKHNQESEDLEALKEGIHLVFQKFKNTMTQKGLKEMEAAGEPFDPEIHEALTKIPAPSKDLKGKVVDVIEKGYFLNEKVIRYSKVVVGE